MVLTKKQTFYGGEYSKDLDSQVSGFIPQESQGSTVTELD